MICYQIAFLFIICSLVPHLHGIIGGRQAAEPPVDDPVVFIRHAHRFARIEGTKSMTTGIYSFRGIHYADAPIGQYRFMRPRFRRPEGDLNATLNGPPCPQPDPTNSLLVIGQEDCLLLNIFTPQMPFDKDALLPVVFFVHPGGFRYGSAAQYGPEPIVQNGVVFVAPQYRLGTLGLFGDGSKSSTTNLAMLDLEAALRWVKEYASFFGGDPNKITPMGHGSGAAAVQYIGMRPQGRSGLNGMILMSGTALSPQMFDETPTRSISEVAQANECQNQKQSELLVCLKNKILESLVLSDSKVQEMRVSENPISGATGMAGFSPVYESEDDTRSLPGMVTFKPDSLLSNGSFPTLPILAGVSKDETALFFNDKRLSTLTKSPDTLLKSIQTYVKLPNVVNIVNSIKSSVDNTAKMFEELISLTTDAFFNLPVYQTLSKWSQHAPAYLYRFEYTGKTNIGKTLLKGLPIVSSTTTQSSSSNSGDGDGSRSGVNNVNAANGVVAAYHGNELGYLFHIYDIHGNKISGSKVSYRIIIQQYRIKELYKLKNFISFSFSFFFLSIFFSCFGLHWPLH